MANKYFFVHNGLTVGNFSIDGSNGNAITTSTTASTSTTTGALQVVGGVGIGGNLNIGGYLNATTGQFSGITTVTNTTVATSTSTGALRVSGGVGIGGALYIGGGVASVSTATGSLVVIGGVGISGALNATTKSFNIGHPTKPGKQLRYGSLEGPEFGVYIRGRVQGNTIELPDYWTKLVDPDSITVDLTPISKHQKLYVEKIENNTVYIGIDGWFAKDINCFYTIYGERADVDKLEVES